MAPRQTMTVKNMERIHMEVLVKRAAAEAASKAALRATVKRVTEAKKTRNRCQARQKNGGSCCSWRG